MQTPVIESPTETLPSADQAVLVDVAPNKPDEHERGRIASLTGVRGVAVLLVVLQHSWLSSHHDGTPLIDHWFRSFNGLWFGVDLFFVLSGFLLTRILLETKDRPNYFRNFYARRGLRIFPVYFAFVAAVVIGGLMQGWTSWGELPWVVTFLTNVSICLRKSWLIFLAGIAISHFWSLSIEEHFYFAWPFFVKTSSRYLFRLCLAGIAATTLLRCGYLLLSHNSFATQVVHVFTPFRLDGLLAGAAVACLHQLQPPTRKHSLIALIAGGCAFAALMAITHMNFVHPIVATIGYTVIAIAGASLVNWLVAPSTGDYLKRLFSNRALLFFGKYSYAIYVFHLPIASLFNHQIQIARIGGSPVTVVCLGIVAPFVCTVLLSVLSWHMLEKHALKLKERFS